MEKVGKSAKFLVSGIAGLFIVFSTSWRPMYYIAAAIVNAIASKVLKNLLQAPRPALSKQGGHGMPSSHAQSLFFFGSSLTCIIISLFGVSPLTIVAALALFSYALTASYWRVQSNLHTLSQTLVGAALGSAAGILAFIKEDEIIGEAALARSGPHDYESVPIFIRVIVVVSGALVLYKIEIKNLLKKKKQVAYLF